MNKFLSVSSAIILSCISFKGMASNTTWWILGGNDMQCREAEFQPSDYLSIKGCNTKFFNKENGTLHIQCRGEINTDLVFNNTFEGCYAVSEHLKKASKKS